MSYKDELKVQINTFDIIDRARFDETAEIISDKWNKNLREIGSNTKIDIREILKKCEKASENGKIKIIVHDEDEESQIDLIPAEELALTELVRKSSPKNNNILMLLDNKKIKLKLNNSYNINGMPENLEIEFENVKNTEIQKNQESK